MTPSPWSAPEGMVGKTVTFPCSQCYGGRVYLVSIYGHNPRCPHCGGTGFITLAVKTDRTPRP